VTKAGIRTIGVCAAGAKTGRQVPPTSHVLGREDKKAEQQADLLVAMIPLACTAVRRPACGTGARSIVLSPRNLLERMGTLRPAATYLAGAALRVAFSDVSPRHRANRPPCGP
jgi:hypothetical protein